MFSRMEWKNKKMIKKLFSFICCLVPFGANAVVVGPENIGDSFVSTDGSAWLATRPTDQTITISDAGVNSIQSPHGFSITNNMYVGATSDQGSQTGNLYILNTVNGGNKSFTIESNGNIYIGEMLQVLDGWNLGFKSNDTTPSPFLMESSVVENVYVLFVVSKRTEIYFNSSINSPKYMILSHNLLRQTAIYALRYIR